MLDSLSSPPKKYLFNYLFLLQGRLDGIPVPITQGRHKLDSLSIILKADLYLISCPHYPKQTFATFLVLNTQERLPYLLVLNTQGRLDGFPVPITQCGLLLEFLPSLLKGDIC